MNKYETMFEAIEGVVDQLRDLEESDEPPGRIYTIRRRLQEAQNDYLKQGPRAKLTKDFEIQCKECGQTQLREEDYYLHLRQQHKYKDEDAATEANQPRQKYDEDMSNLRALMAEYTDTLPEENHG